MDRRRLAVSIAHRADYADLFDPGPLLAACDAWDVAPAEASTPAAIAAPTLVMRGWFDPYSTPPIDLEKAFLGRQNAYVFEVPNESYNAFGYTECPRTIRNAWLDAVDAPPVDTSCLTEIPPPDLGG